MNSNTYLFIDFDSTFVTTETLEEIACVALKDNPLKVGVLKQIQTITNLGMEGKISFEESLKRRMRLLSATKDDVTKVINLLKKRVTPSIKRNIDFFRTHKDNVYIISGGFKECVVPVVEDFGIPENHVLVNTFTLDQKGNITGVDASNPLAGTNGKYLAVKALGVKGISVVIGDGYTDYQVKELGAADYFIAFTENVKRKSVTKKADFIAENFNEVLTFISTQDL